KVVRNADKTRTKVLRSVKVRPAASVEATGPVTLGSGQITVATLAFTFPNGFTLSPKITDGKVVKAFGSAATRDGPIVLKRVAKKRFGHRVHANKAAKAASALISGRVSDLTAATAADAGSLKVGGITLAIPAGKVLRAKVANGARVTAWAVVMND